MTAVRRLPVIGVVAAAVLALSGCSQVDALVPVSGGPESIVRNATIDVLLRADVDVLLAPTCAANDGRTVIRCTGRSGDDTYIVDNVGDVVHELPGGGFDTVKSAVTYALAADVGGWRAPWVAS